MPEENDTRKVFLGVSEAQAHLSWFGFGWVDGMVGDYHGPAFVE